MKTLVMAVAHSQAGNWPLEQLRKLGNPNTSNPTRWSVDVHDDWIAVSTATSVRGDYDLDEIESIKAEIGDPEFYVLEAHTGDIMAQYIQMLPDNREILIDNDHGWIGSLEAYKAAIKIGADWLYIRNSP